MAKQDDHIGQEPLANYSTWPELFEVFKPESQRTDALGQVQQEVHYGLTSLPAHSALQQPWPETLIQYIGVIGSAKQDCDRFEIPTPRIVTPS